MNAWALIPLFSCITFAALFFIVLQQTRKQVDRVFVIFLLSSAIWDLVTFMMIYNPSASEVYLKFWNVFVIASIPLVAVTYYHFVRTYIGENAGPLAYIGYIFVLVVLIFGLTGNVIKRAWMDNGRMFHEIAPWEFIIAAVLVPLLALTIMMLVKKYRSSQDPADRNRTMYLIIGWSITIVISYITPFTPALKVLPTDHIGNLANALIITYAITKLNLLDIRLIIRRGLAYSIIAVVLVGIAVGGVIIGRTLFPSEQTIILMVVTIVIILILVTLARPLTRITQNAVDRLFFGESFISRETLLAFSTRIGNIIDLNELADAMLAPVSKALRITEARLMFQQNGGGNFITQYAYPKENKEDNLTFSLDNPLIALLQKENNPIDLKQIDSLPQLKGLWQVDRERLSTSGLEFLHPIKSRGRLIGILALGKKTNNRLYLSEDIELIKSMSSQAGIIIDNARLYSQAVTWANTDGLTELYNHRHFHERLDQEIARGSRFGSIFSLIIMDLDHFKTFNDNYGHLAGDEVLRRVGRCIESSIRSVDMAFRYGGEEFAIILPGTRLNDAYKAAERIRNTIEAKASPGTMPVTASLGISTWPIDGMTKEDIISRADAALYQAKQNGRNRVLLSSEVVKGQTSLIGMELETKEKAVSIIYALAATVDAKDHYTYGHSKKVSQYAVSMAETMGLTTQKIATIRAAGLLHDIGKIAVPDSILNKAGPLTDEEWEPIKAHPELGMEILKHVIDLVNCLPAILHHHEHFDGSGYPGSLKGEEIPMEARILAIADTYDAITSVRPYRNQLTPQEALDELRRCAGTQFDPEFVKVFCRAIESTLPKHIEVEP
jgi:diguanylate cyclase (GGDEF)-like protein/putative nucleotidyltransferase with HDIG domain